jgi:hypothetical protein
MTTVSVLTTECRLNPQHEHKRGEQTITKPSGALHFFHIIAKAGCKGHGVTHETELR